MPIVRKSPHVTATIDPEARATARRAGLVYVNDTQPGIRRRKAGKGFSYVDSTGRRISNAQVLARIRSLAVPPAYTDVWICADALGHLQATGRDARQRKQYRYHPDWRSTRDDGKFGRMAAFGAALPTLRRWLKRDLALPGLPEAKVLATVVSLLAGTLIRVGNEAYARDNRSYGLTTLRSRHVAVMRGRLTFRFRGKSGLEHDVSLDDAQLARIVRRCQQLPGQALFQYLDDDGQHRPIDSGMVNAYLRDAMGDHFTAKDFRTWGGTLHAIAVLSGIALPEQGGERAIDAVIADAVRTVAAQLRNTPAVCRKSYIHPHVFEAWRHGTLQRLVAAKGRSARKLESVALRLLAAGRKQKA